MNKICNVWPPNIRCALNKLLELCKPYFSVMVICNIIIRDFVFIGCFETFHFISSLSFSHFFLNEIINIFSSLIKKINIFSNLFLDQLKTLIQLINRNYGVGAARNIGVTLKLRNKLPSENFKTKRDFLEQLRQSLLQNGTNSITTL